jgi:hypothetical protein
MLAVMAVVSTAWATDSSNIANLFYDPATGNVRVSAKEAAGAKITSFQFENAEGTFIPGNYTGPTGGTFGGFLKNVTTKVIADSDLTFVGFSGNHNFGNIFPAGMDLDQLDTYLTVSVYTGALGTEQKDIDMLLLPYLPDANGDEEVDAADYIILKQNFGMPSGALWSQGNFSDGLDGVGTVDWDDLQILMAEFGTRSVGGAPAVPEPATLGLLAIGALAVLRRRRRRA